MEAHHGNSMFVTDSNNTLQLMRQHGDENWASPNAEWTANQFTGKNNQSADSEARESVKSFLTKYGVKHNLAKGFVPNFARIGSRAWRENWKQHRIYWEDMAPDIQKAMARQLDWPNEWQKTEIKENVSLAPTYHAGVQRIGRVADWSQQITEQDVKILKTAQIYQDPENPDVAANIGHYNLIDVPKTHIGKGLVWPGGPVVQAMTMGVEELGNNPVPMIVSPYKHIPEFNKWLDQQGIGTETGGGLQIKSLLPSETNIF